MALELAPVRMTTVQRVKIAAPTPAVLLAAIPEPRTRQEAWRSLLYCVSVHLVGRNADELTTIWSAPLDSKGKEEQD
jgi:hypothetical protein